MRPKHRGAWSYLAFVVVVAALGIGGSAGAIHRSLSDAAGVSRRPVPAGSLDAVLRTPLERVEGALSESSSTTSRLILESVAALVGAALLVGLRRSRHTVVAHGPPPLTRLRHRVGLRAPPSSSLV
jgi:hypothetical protein